MITEFEYGMDLWDDAVAVYEKYMQNHQMLATLSTGDRLTFWLLVYASEGKGLP